MNTSKKVSFKPLLLVLFFSLFYVHTGFSQSKSKAINELVNNYYELRKFNGSVLVAHKGKVVFKKGFGMANMEWDIPNRSNTKHRLGSITKQFTAMLILQLAADGTLDLHQPLTTYLPDYPKKSGDIITTHHLLTHTSGIPNYTALPGFMRDESRTPYKPADFVSKFSEMKLEFTPGEKFNYSNSGYFLLGLIVEKLTEKTYEEVLEEKIFAPLKMNDTGFDHHATILKNRATGYERRGFDFVNSRYIDMSIPYAAGSMYSTVEDLFLWDRALYTNQLLDQKHMDLYFKAFIPAFGSSQYAYGWAVGKEKIGSTTDSIYAISHGGGINGFNTIISRTISDQSVVILLNNTGGAPLNRMTQAIRGILYEKSYDQPKKSIAFHLYKTIEAEGYKKGLAFFHKNKESKDFELIEGEMNQVGYNLMGAGKVAEAAEVFKINTEAFPESFNVYDSYGEALMNLGKTELAIKNYKKSIEMNPANQGGIEMLKKMGVDTQEFEKEFVVSEDILDTYLGKYELAPSFIITVTREGSQLKAQATGQPMFDVFPKSEKVFYLKVVTAQITFHENENGEIVSLTLLQGGRKTTGKKLVEQKGL